MSARGWYMAVCLAALIAGCDVHEFPGEERPEQGNTTLRLLLQHDMAMPEHTTMYYGDTRAAAGYDTRYTINLYPIESRNEPSRAASHSYVLTQPYGMPLDGAVTLDAAPGVYRAMVWTDYVVAGTDDALYYNTADSQSVTMSLHEGNTHMRQAWRGIADVEVRERATLTFPVELQRPMARYHIIATDVVEFAEQVRVGNTRAAQLLPDGTRALDVEGYNVRIRYAGYMPSVFNMFIDHPSDALTGVVYDGPLRQLSATEMELAFDYVLTNGAETAVTLAVEVHDRDGTVLARSAPFNVPLLRSHVTYVRGRFLTATTGSQTAINPDFDGEYNIEIL